MKYSELKAHVNTLNTLIEKNATFKKIDLYVEKTTLIAQSECKDDTEIDRITFTITDENTKRSSTVYCYFHKATKKNFQTETHFECSKSFLTNFTEEKEKEFRTLFKESQQRYNVFTKDFATTLYRLLEVHNIKREVSTAQKTKSTAKKSAKQSKKAQ